jgi:hypothetical protein
MMRLVLFAILTTACGSTLELEPPPLRVHGQKVLFDENAALEGNAGAAWVGGEPHIWYHPDRFPELPNDVQWWTLGHELAHLHRPGLEEEAADCYGVRWLSAMGALSDSTVASITDLVSTYHASEVHPSGPLRSLNIFACVTGLDLLWSE